MTFRKAVTLYAAAAVVLVVLGAVYDRGLAYAVPFSLPLVIVSVRLCLWLDRDHKLGLADIFLLALTLRWIVSASIELAVYRHDPYLFAPDEAGYHETAVDYARRMAGRPGLLGGSQPITARGLVWTAATCYYLVGAHVFVPKFLNGVLGAWTAVITALLAVRLVSSAVAARRAGLLAAVFPSLVLWSSLLLKDVWTLLGAQIVLLCFLHLRQRFRMPALAGLVLGLFLIVVNRPYEVLFVSVSLVASFAFGSSRHIARNFVLFALLAVILAFAIAKSGALSEAFGQRYDPLLERVAFLRRVYSVHAGSAVKTSLIDTTTTLGLIKWIPLGVVFFFLAPIPFTGSSGLSLMTTPEMLLWYALLPSVYRGLRSQLRGTNREFWPVLLYVIVATVSWGTTITNVGTLYRYRAQVFFFPLILIAADQVARAAKRKRERAAEERALRAARQGPAREVENG